ncbi:MAG TPA: ribonuclease P protein component [Panacibacter sp.]|nr:ribonuclease P protein component [Panacibacter sp.]
MKAGNKYGRQEKTKSRKQVEQLFESGKSISVFPLKIFYMPVAEQMDFPLKTGVSVSSRNFKKAVDRNRIKRLLREAYRTEKHVLIEKLEQSQQQLVCFIIYTGKTLPSLNDLQLKIKTVIKKLSETVDEKNPANT